MNLKYIYVDGRIVYVNNLSSIVFRNRKTYIVNNKYRIGQKTKIGYICNNCKCSIEQMYKYNQRFSTGDFICAKCLAKKNADNNGGFPFEKKKVQDKVKKTFLNKYGDTTPARNIDVKNKIKFTISHKTQQQMHESKEKTEKTCIERYGAKTPLESQIVINKIKQTNMNKYGSEYFLGTEYAKRAFKKVMFEKYNVSHWMKDEYKKKQQRETMVERYGYKYALQNKSLHEKQLSALGTSQKLKTINENLHYQNSYELNCIDYCWNKNIEIWDGPSIPYIFKGKKHIYHIDFETDLFLIEIKGSHGWYYEDLASGKIEAKAKAAEKHAKSLGKKFLFLLDVEDYSKYI